MDLRKRIRFAFCNAFFEQKRAKHGIRRRGTSKKRRNRPASVFGMAIANLLPHDCHRAVRRPPAHNVRGRRRWWQKDHLIGGLQLPQIHFGSGEILPPQYRHPPDPIFLLFPAGKIQKKRNWHSRADRIGLKSVLAGGRCRFRVVIFPDLLFPVDGRGADA